MCPERYRKTRTDIPAEVLYRRLPSNHDKVILVSGGGSGHEPAHAGYLGEGALDIVVAGEIFASPSASQVLAGLRTLNSSRGSVPTTGSVSL